MAILASSAPHIGSMSQAPMPPWGHDKEGPEAHEYVLDPKAFLLERCEHWLKNIRFMQHYVFAATYYLPPFDIMANGKPWFRADVTHDEALWQGKVGLVLGKGPLAFVDDDRVKHHGQNVQVGDWIWWDIHDARQYTINRVHCRFIADVRILGVVDDPRLIY